MSRVLCFRHVRTSLVYPFSLWGGTPQAKHSSYGYYEHIFPPRTKISAFFTFIFFHIFHLLCKNSEFTNNNLVSIWGTAQGAVRLISHAKEMWHILYEIMIQNLMLINSYCYHHNTLFLLRILHRNHEAQIRKISRIV